MAFVVFAVLLVLAFILRRRLLRSKKLLAQSFEANQQNIGLTKQVEKLTICNTDLEAQNHELREILKQKNSEIDHLQRNLDLLKGHLHEQVLLKTSELHTQLEKAKEGNRLKEAFLDKISREVRTPLNSILGFINLLNDENISKIDRDYYLKYIRESGNNLLGLIDNIIDFSKLETGELLIEFKRCNLNTLLTDLIDRYRHRFLREKPNLTLIYNKPESVNESLADCKKVIHVVEQLINNALKYTTDGKIEVDYSIADGLHIIKVCDTGVGIDSKYHDIIFETFYQIDHKSRDVFDGAGLGLAIAKKITDLLGGSLSLESQVGSGTTFTLKVPFKDIIAGNITEKTIETDYNWTDKTILIAEDEDTNFHLLDAVLKKTKVKILRADDGVKFLEIINDNKNIDLVLLDIKMPGINGFNAIKVIRQQNINIPVIAQTAFNQPEDKQRCLDSGCNDYLAKPIDKELLISKISKYICP